VCLTPTDTGLMLEGEAEFLTAALVRLGIPEDQAVEMVGQLAQDEYGCDPGKVPTSDMSVGVTVCSSCAAKTGFKVRLKLPVGEMMAYRQGDWMRSESEN